jgi:hypothetical protein
MPLARFTRDEDTGTVIIEGQLDQRQTVYHLQRTVVGNLDLFEVVRDMNIQGRYIRVTIQPLES